MITKDLHEALAKIEKLHEALKNIHLLDLLPELIKNQEKLIKQLEKSDNFKSKLEGK